MSLVKGHCQGTKTGLFCAIEEQADSQVGAWSSAKLCKTKF